MLLAVVLTMAVLPAAGTLVYISRSDLAAALDDYHHMKAETAARAALDLVKANLQHGGQGSIHWPDPEVQVSVSVIETVNGLEVRVTANSGTAYVIKEEKICFVTECNTK